MSRVARWLGAIIALGLGAAALVLLYRNHRDESAGEAERDAPVVAPSRVIEDSAGVVVALRAGDRVRIGLALAALRPAAAASEERLPAEVLPESDRAAVPRAPVP